MSSAKMGWSLPKVKTRQTLQLIIIVENESFASIALFHPTPPITRSPSKYSFLQKNRSRLTPRTIQFFIQLWTGNNAFS